MSVIIGQESPAARPLLAEGALAPPAMTTGSILSERCLSQSPRFTPPPTFAKGCSKPGSLCVILNSHLLGAFPPRPSPLRATRAGSEASSPPNGERAEDGAWALSPPPLPWKEGQPGSTQIASGEDRRARPREQEMRGDPVPFETEKALPPRAKPLNLLAGEELLNLLARR